MTNRTETPAPMPTMPERLETVTVNGRIETLIRTRLGNQAICTSGSGRNDAESAAIAVEIVRRWNAHAALVAACRSALAALQTMEPHHAYEPDRAALRSALER